MRAGPQVVALGLQEGPEQSISTLAALKSTGEVLDRGKPGLHPLYILIYSVCGGALEISIF